jgi:hypothetical protein
MLLKVFKSRQEEVKLNKDLGIAAFEVNEVIPYYRIISVDIIPKLQAIDTALSL